MYLASEASLCTAGVVDNVNTDRQSTLSVTSDASVFAVGGVNKVNV